VPGDAFDKTREEVMEIKEMQELDPRGLASHIAMHHDSFEYVALFVPDVKPDYGGFLESGRYHVVYENGSAVILRRAG
jgi:hypothetical protein